MNKSQHQSQHTDNDITYLVRLPREYTYAVGCAVPLASGERPVGSSSSEPSGVKVGRRKNEGTVSSAKRRVRATLLTLGSAGAAATVPAASEVRVMLFVWVLTSLGRGVTSTGVEYDC